jgi:hypothetical protein
MLIEEMVNRRLREILLESANEVAKDKGSSAHVKVIQNMSDQEVRNMCEIMRSMNDEKSTGEDKKKTNDQNLDW